MEKKIMGEISKSRIISLVIAIIDLALIFLVNSEFGYEGNFFFCAVFGFACVWFGDAMGGWKGIVPFMQVTRTSSGDVMRFFGWILLFLPVILVLCHLVKLI